MVALSTLTRLHVIQRKSHKSYIVHKFNLPVCVLLKLKSQLLVPCRYRRKVTLYFVVDCRKT